MTHFTCRLTAKNRDQLRNPTLGNRVWAYIHLMDGVLGWQWHQLDHTPDRMHMICTAPRSRRKTTPTTHHSIFTGQPTVLKHWRHSVHSEWQLDLLKGATYIMGVLIPVRRGLVATIDVATWIFSIHGIKLKHWSISETSLHSATYVRWRHGTIRIRPTHTADAEIDQYLLLQGPQQQTCSRWFAVVGPWRDRQTLFRFTDPAPHAKKYHKMQNSQKTAGSNYRQLIHTPV